MGSPGTAPSGGGGSGRASGPATPAPGAPSAGAASGARGGMALDFRRGKTAKKLLKIDWVHPTWKPAEPKPGLTTAAVEVEHALPAAEAYAVIAGSDERPMLVLRECEQCKGTDHALLSQTLDNEQTVLLTRWFRCVKLPPIVLDEKHPFTNLFARKPGERPAHLFFADPDGQNRNDLPGDQVQAKLWEVMFGYLERCYHGDAKKAVKELRGLLSQFDRVDVLEQQVRSRIDTEIEKNGAKSPKLKSLEAELARIGKERDELEAREKALRALALRTMQAGKPAAGAAK